MSPVRPCIIRESLISNRTYRRERYLKIVMGRYLKNHLRGGLTG